MSEALLRVVVRERVERQIIIDCELVESLAENRREIIGEMVQDVTSRLLTKANRRRKAREALVIDISVGCGRRSE